LGLGNLEDQLIPSTVAREGDERFQRLKAGYYHTCAIDLRSRLWCWGHNGLGQLGDGTLTNRTEPTLILFD
jgi:alpha-tubulin suppressor-like RCC1 family protein